MKMNLKAENTESVFSKNSEFGQRTKESDLYEHIRQNRVCHVFELHNICQKLSTRR